MLVVAVVIITASVAPQDDDAEQGEEHTGDGEPWAHAGSHVAPERTCEGESGEDHADDGGEGGAGVGAHSSNAPTRTAALDGDAERERGEERREPATERSGLEGDELHVDHRADDHEGQRAVSENCVRLAATKASASEQIARITARPARASTPSDAAVGDAVEQ